nr:hypothetical protein [Comamonas thiooxydans]
MSHSEHTKEAQLLPIPGTFNDQFQVIVDGVEVGRVAWRQLAELTERQLAQAAPSSIALKGGAALGVYEARTPRGCAGSSDALRLEMGQESAELSAKAARDLARVLLAYAESGNDRCQWLVRRELS